MKHTPGPWIVGSVWGQHLKHGETTCHHCGKLPLLSITESKAGNPRDYCDTVHNHLWTGEGEFRTIVSQTGETIVGNYDYEAGGVATSEADARLIAAAPELLQALQALLADTQHSKHVCGDENCPVAAAHAAVAKATGDTE